MRRPLPFLLLLALPFTALRVTAQAAPTVNAAASFVPADVQFMQGMIGHHAQALVMAAMAPSHGASAKLLQLCKKINISQHDEIVMMQGWLKERNQPVPDASGAMPHAGMKMDMPMADHGMMMPGMLTAEQLKQLDQARGVDFDRLFLKFMIQHHEGALKMVADLFATPGAGQGTEMFRYATDVDADQRAEIERMQQLLTQIPGSK